MSRQPYKKWITPEGVELMTGWARDGCTNAEIAKRCGVSGSTLALWLGKYPEMAAAIEASKEVIDNRVEGALLKRALGYDYTERKTIITVDADGNKTQRIEETLRHVPGDVTGQIFWMKNRRPHEWRDRREMELMGEVGLVQIVDDIPKATEVLEVTD